jgi:two-component system LytT family response regulator
MQKIKTFLIDDEEKALKSIELKLNEKWDNVIDITGTFQDPEVALEAIKSEKPQLIFLDISMPQLSGLELLEKIENPNFEIIFVTAYSDYAIEAIKNCAIGYIVKPIDIQDLETAINNALKNIELKNALQKNRTLIENLNTNSSADKKIIIPSLKGLDFIKIKDIVRCEGEQGYTKIIICNKKEILSSYNIGKFVKMLANKSFFQTHRSHLVNLKWVKGLLNEGYVIMENDDHIPLSKSLKQDFIAKMNKL